MRVIASTNVHEIREPRAYLTTIANGLLINHWRRSAIERAYLERLSAYPEEVTISTEESAIILEVLREIDECVF